jgi:hypothetical protein
MVAQSAHLASVNNMRWVAVANSEWRIGLAAPRRPSPLVASFVEVVRAAA